MHYINTITGLVLKNPAHAWLGEGLLLCGKPMSLMRNILIKVAAYFHQRLTPLIDTRLVH